MKEEQSSSENLTQDINSPAVLAANGKQSLEVGAALWSPWFEESKSSEADSCTASGCGKWHQGLKKVGHRCPSATGTPAGSFLLACAEVGWMFSVNSCILRVHIQNPFIIIETIKTEGLALLKSQVCGVVKTDMLNWDWENQRTQSSLVWFSQRLWHRQGWTPGVSGSCPPHQPPGRATRMREDAQR